MERLSSTRRTSLVVTTLSLLMLGVPAAAEADVWDGVDSCAHGYVWREAVPGDNVCVEPWMRDLTRSDNAAAPGRWTGGASGSHACIPGFVQRKAVDHDDVCVSPWTRVLVILDNASAARRTAPADEYHCIAIPGERLPGLPLPLPPDIFCVRFVENSVIARYNYNGFGADGSVGVFWYTNRNERGTIPARIMSPFTAWEAQSRLKDGSVGTCVTATAAGSTPPFDINGRPLGGSTTVCRRY